jgi:hypothetical protein
MIVSLIAAAMAGFGAWVNQAAGFFTRDLYQHYLRPSAVVHELIFATWIFIAAIVSAGFVFAYWADSINDLWGWIIMGLGSGMIFSQLLPLYWQRFNGVGYTAGMIGGITTALAQRFFGHWLAPDWAFLNSERWLLPTVGLSGLAASVIGALTTSPTPEPVLRHFYNRTLPFGLWSPYREDLPRDLGRRVVAEHCRDMTALPLVLLFQTTAFLTPMLAVIRYWEGFFASAGIMILAFAGIYLFWLRHLSESDAVATAARQLPSASAGAGTLPLRDSARGV